MKVVQRDAIRSRKRQGAVVGKIGKHEPGEGWEFSQALSMLKEILLRPVPTPQITVSPAKVEMPKPDRVKKWRFKIERNADGYISGITAERVE